MDVIETADGVTFTVRVVPRSSSTEIIGEHNGALKVKLRSPPVDGAANKELIRFFAETFGVPRAEVMIISGLTSRTKRVRVNGVDGTEIKRFLQG